MIKLNLLHKYPSELNGWLTRARHLMTLIEALYAFRHVLLAMPAGESDGSTPVQLWVHLFECFIVEFPECEVLRGYIFQRMTGASEKSVLSHPPFRFRDGLPKGWDGVRPLKKPWEVITSRSRFRCAAFAHRWRKWCLQERKSERNHDFVVGFPPEGMWVQAAKTRPYLHYFPETFGIGRGVGIPRTHVIGTAKVWLPSAWEVQSCCHEIRYPLADDRRSLYDHVHSIAHMAYRFGIRKPHHLANYIKYVEKYGREPEYSYYRIVNVTYPYSLNNKPAETRVEHGGFG